MSVFRRLLSNFRKDLKEKNIVPQNNEITEGPVVFSGYVTGQPTSQALIDLIDGWNCAFPKRVNVKAGSLHLYADPRIQWAVKQANGIQQKKILEIGPLEGAHSFLLQSYRPLIHIAVEASRNAFLKCLIAKELYPLRRVQFKLGDGVAYLRTESKYFDLIIASGILYHLQDPLEFLKLASEKSRELYLWTHFIDDQFVVGVGDPRLVPFSGKIETDSRFGFAIRFLRRRYMGAQLNPEFCGGLADEHIWLHRDDLVHLLKQLGFKYVLIAHEQLDHKHGPACSIFAGR